jgi:hypothetical protein
MSRNLPLEMLTCDPDPSKRRYACRVCGKILSFEQLFVMPSSWPDSFFSVCERCWRLSAGPARQLISLRLRLQLQER